MSRQNKERIIGITGLLITISFVMKLGNVLELSSDILMITAALLAGYPIMKNAFQALRYRILGIEALVTIAVIGAIMIREYWEAAAVTFLFIFGSYLEARIMEKTRSSLKALMDLAPAMASVMRDGIEVQVSPDEVIQGEIVLVRPGEKIPADGTVLKGKATINQAAITGESVPVSREKGAIVFSGTVIEHGYLEIIAEKVGDDTTFARILNMVEEAQESKAPTQKFIERFARYYTPAIFILAIIVYISTGNVELTLTLLVIACPGAMVISAPVSIVAGIGKGARNGILFKGGETLEKAGFVQVVAFDKTGTLTAGKPQVTRINAIHLNENELLQMIARAEYASEHHLARAIVAEAASRSASRIIPAEQFKALPGKGIAATVEGSNLYIGNRRLLADYSIQYDQEIADYVAQEENRAQTVVFAADDERVLGVISIADVLRTDAYALIHQLKRSGVHKVVMLTGDNERSAAAVSGELGIDQYYAELLPEDKVRIVQDLQKEYIVAMVGDGVNDAPALAVADVGIAMGGSGTDAAMETADMVLMSDRLMNLPYALGLSRASMNNIRQNIYFAVATVVTLLIGVLTSNVFMASGMLVHELSVLLVILNAMRLTRYTTKNRGSRIELQSSSSE
ncbi:cation-translocating P-type ATPase [Paenibacillus sp. FSL R5-0912]|uniref:heavy metal translocating P-type ATPase n=1 Tax=Paenibacillus sp. FSL R5-0912 TaxID=1536771 RepID=UPI0004F6FA56|nr:cation-translocating P-type ATPase [Paenibacillus sp. FSL R5-0912]AIQ44381.1 HAD family hydrolase [Paenibacillus sp. FSL R5-0912]